MNFKLFKMAPLTTCCNDVTNNFFANLQPHMHVWKPTIVGHKFLLETTWKQTRNETFKVHEMEQSY